MLTVVLSHDIPNKVSESFYRRTPYVYLKIHATEPSSAIRNAKETADVLIKKYESKENVPPILTVYTTSGRPEHRSNFLSVQIAMIALQRYLNLDSLIVARTAPGHSYTKPPEKVKSVFNLPLSAIGCMSSAVHNDPNFIKLPRRSE